jgi:hypothetical protein
MPDFSAVSGAKALASLLPVPVGAAVTVPEPSTPLAQAASGATLLAVACRRLRSV